MAIPLNDNYTGQIIDQILRNWQNEVTQITKNFDKHPEHIFAQPVAPGRNSGWYILGHLTATADAMFPLFFLGEPRFPELGQFLHLPEKDVRLDISVGRLRDLWAQINVQLVEKLKAFTASEWMERHALVAEADFIKEPHRNRLNVLLSRSSHIRYHIGQLVLLPAAQ